MTTEKPNFQAILSELSELGVNHVGLAAKLEQIRLQSIAGWEQEKVATRSETGKVDLLEKYPEIAARCIALQFQIFQDAMNRANDTQSETDISFTVNVLPLEEESK